MRIRKARISDLDQIVELGYKLLKHHCRYRNYYQTSPNKAERIKHQKKYFRKELKSRNSHFLVAEQHGRLIGYVIGKIVNNPIILKEKKHGDVAEIYVDKAYRGKGLGTKLMKACFEWFKKRKVSRAVVKYDAKNKQAENTYRKSGFRPFQNEYSLDLVKR